MIKKIMYLLTLLIAILLVYTSYDAYNQKYVDVLLAYQDHVGLIENKKTIPMWFTFNNKDEIAPTIEELTTYAKANKITFMSMIEGSEGVSKTTRYGIYSQNPNILNHLRFESNKKIDFSEDNDIYLSSDHNDEAKAGRLLSFDDNYFSLYGTIFTISNISMSTEFIEEQMACTFIFYDDEIGIEQEIETLLGSKNLGVKVKSFYEGYHPSIAEEIYEAKNAYTQPLLLACSIMLLLLLLVQVTKDKKELMIRRMHGSTILYIMKKKYLWFFIKIYATFLGTIYAVYFIICKDILSLSVEMRNDISYTLIYFLLILLFVFIIEYIYIRYSTHIDNIKQGHKISEVKFTCVFKIIMIVLMMSPFIKLANEAFVLFNEYLVVKNKENVLSSLISIEDEMLTYNDKNILFDYYNKNGGLYIDFENYISNQYENLISYVPEDMVMDEVIDYPMIYANANYLKMYAPIFDLENNEIDVEAIKEDTLLIPKRYEKEKLNKACYSNDCKKVIIQDTDRFLNFAFGRGVDSLENPVIHVVVALRDETKNRHMYLSKSDIKNGDYYEQEIKGLVSNTVTIKDVSTNMNYLFQNTMIVLKEFTFFCILYSIVLLIFAYEYVYLFYAANTKLITVKYLLGKSRLMRYGEMILTNIVLYLVPLVIGIFVYKLPVINCFVFILMMIILEVLLEYTVIQRIERRRISSLVKGENII